MVVKLPFPKLRYCLRCCIPETQEGIKFDEMGICQACQSSEQKIHINWKEKERLLRKILELAKARAGNNYDCIVPISGGKDSTFQLHVLTKVYNMKPLAVTFNHNWYSETGWYNLTNSLETFGVDHVMFTPNRSLVNRIAKRSLWGIGDACWHCHTGVASFPLKMAVAYKIPLVIWGESVAESSGRASYKNKDSNYKFDPEYFTKVSTKLTAEEMTDRELSLKDLCSFKAPALSECKKIGLKLLHLGDYIFWDEERQTEFIRDTYGWRETEIEGTYKRYKSAECIMPGVHDFTNYLKRGYGRASFHAGMDVRNGLLTREEAFDLINKYDAIRPEALDYFLEITGMTEAEFYKVMETKKLPQLKNVKLPVKPKLKANEERILPYAEQLLNKYRPPININVKKSSKRKTG